MSGETSFSSDHPGHKPDDATGPWERMGEKRRTRDDYACASCAMTLGASSGIDVKNLKILCTIQPSGESSLLGMNRGVFYSNERE